MKRSLTLLVLVVLFVAIVGSVGAITNGVPDGDGHPGAGAIIVYPLSPGGPKWVLCSGVLIHPRAFLTAGHCTARIQRALDAGIITLDSTIRVSFDSADSLNNGHLTVDDVHTHPGYWSSSAEMGSVINDVGILVLEQPAAAPVTPLPTVGFLDQLKEDKLLRDSSDGADFAVVGYGTTLDWPPPEQSFWTGDGIRRASESEFLNVRSTWLHMSQNQAPGNGNGGSCYGDSGGPVYWIGPDGEELLVALTSWGDAPCVATGTAWRVDLPETLDFVEDVLDSLD